jgi:hypothetical protein
MAHAFPSLRPEQRVACARLYGTVDAVSKHSYNKSQSRTTQSRIEHFESKFLRATELKDPTFLEQSLHEMFLIFAMYVVYLGMGHTLLCKTVKSRTIKSYVTDAAATVQRRREAYARAHPSTTLSWFCPIRPHGDTKFAPPIAACLKEVQRWENMENRREPLTTDMVQFQKTLTCPSKPHSLEQALYDWWVCGIYAGFRKSEWAQDEHVRFRHQVKLTIDDQPVAFLIDDLEFFGENRRRMTLAYALRFPHLVQQIDLRWRFQKNGNKNEKKTFVRIGRGHSATLCAVSAFMRIAQRWLELNLPRDHPLAVFTNDGTASGTPDFIRSPHINDALRNAARVVYNVTAAADLARFSSHSIRVGACVALHAAGIQQQDIKFALRWKSDSFYAYLRNLPCQAARTASAVLNFNPQRFTLIPDARIA